MQHDMPVGYDLVVVVRPHGEMILAEYQKLMSALVIKLHKAWVAKRKQDDLQAGAERER